MSNQDEISKRIQGLPPEKRALLERQLSAHGINVLSKGNSPSSIHEQAPRSANSRQEPTPDRRPNDLPVLMPAPKTTERLSTWLPENSGVIEQTMLQSGAILFRGFHIDGPIAFQDCIEAISGTPMDYPGIYQGAAVRRHVYGKIYTSTEFSPEYRLHLHSECSFAHCWPLRLFFLCTKASRQGGETPLADIRGILQRLSPAVRAKFEDKGVMYVRNYGIGSAPSWQSIFNTDNRYEVGRFCSSIGVATEWISETRLRTRSVRPALMKHPQTGELVWFNHVNSAHVWSNEPVLRDALLTEFEPQDLPRNCYYGDGSDIDVATLEVIRDAYQQETTLFDWQDGDLLMLDNMLTAHGRQPYVGERQVLVGMAVTVRRNSQGPRAFDAEVDAG